MTAMPRGLCAQCDDAAALSAALHKYFYRIIAELLGGLEFTHFLSTEVRRPPENKG